MPSSVWLEKGRSFWGKLWCDFRFLEPLKEPTSSNESIFADFTVGKKLRAAKRFSYVNISQWGKVPFEEATGLFVNDHI